MDVRFPLNAWKSLPIAENTDSLENAWHAIGSVRPWNNEGKLSRSQSSDNMKKFHEKK